MKRRITLSDVRAWVIVIVLLAGTCLVSFPSGLVLDLFWDKVEMSDIEQIGEDHYYGQLAGLPAGESIPVVENVEQCSDVFLEALTFETDSIIPLDAYYLKNSHRTSYTRRSRSGRPVTVHIPMYQTHGNPWTGIRYNRYYLLGLPDGNYVLAFLDDSYYIKYLLNGKVQLPVGHLSWMNANQKEMFAPYIEEYGLDDRDILIMFSESRFIQYEVLFYVIAGAFYVIVEAVVIALIVFIFSLFEKKKKEKP